MELLERVHRQLRYMYIQILFICRSKKQAANSEHRSSQCNNVADDKQELLTNDATCERESEITQRANDLETVYGSSSNLLAEHQGGSSDGGGGVSTESGPTVGSATGDDESVDDRACSEEGGGETPQRRLSNASRRGSFIIPFFNRRGSFTPSYFRPPKKWRGRQDRSVANGVQRLVFEEEGEEETGLGQEIEMEGRGEREQGESEGRKGESEGACKTSKWTQQLKTSLKRTLQNLKLFFT